MQEHVRLAKQFQDLMQEERLRTKKLIHETTYPIFDLKRLKKEKTCKVCGCYHGVNFSLWMPGMLLTAISYGICVTIISLLAKLSWNSACISLIVSLLFVVIGQYLWIHGDHYNTWRAHADDRIKTRKELEMPHTQGELLTNALVRRTSEKRVQLLGTNGRNPIFDDVRAALKARIQELGTFPPDHVQFESFHTGGLRDSATRVRIDFTEKRRAPLLQMIQQEGTICQFLRLAGQTFDQIETRATQLGKSLDVQASLIANTPSTLQRDQQNDLETEVDAILRALNNLPSEAAKIHFTANQTLAQSYEEVSANRLVGHWVVPPTANEEVAAVIPMQTRAKK